MTDAFLFSPCLSPFDDVENGILSVYIVKAIQNVRPQASTPRVYNLLLDTPWVMYRAEFLRTSNEPTKYAVMTFALTAIVLYLISLSSFVVVNANGPVMNEGVSALVGYLAAANKPILYWKDDVRHLYGARDNPFVVGLLSSITHRVVNAVDRLATVDCRKLVFDDQLRALFTSYRSADINVAPRLQFLIGMGRELYNATYFFARANDPMRNPFMKSDDEVYEIIHGIFMGYAASESFKNYYPEDAMYFTG